MSIFAFTHMTLPRAAAGLVLLAAIVAASPRPTSVLQARSGHTTVRQETVEVPLLIAEGRVIVPVAVEGAGKQFFILDTAASSSVISSRLRGQLEVDPSGVRRDTVRGASGHTVMEKVLLPGVGIGGETFTDVDAVVTDISDFREYEGRQVEGILGTDVLQRYDLEIDAAGGVMRLHRREGKKTEGASGIPFESRSASGFVEFELSVNGQPVRGVLDTAARRSVFNWAAAWAAGVSPEDPALRERAKGTRGIGGRSTQTYLYTFDDLQLGPAHLRAAEVKIADLPVFEVLGIAEGPAMLVGIDVLQACPVSVSYSTGRLGICE